MHLCGATAAPLAQQPAELWPNSTRDQMSETLVARAQTVERLLPTHPYVRSSLIIITDTIILGLYNAWIDLGWQVVDR
jgi:hypothetical protein